MREMERVLSLVVTRLRLDASPKSGCFKQGLETAFHLQFGALLIS
jgi:hypothetical protein